ncbi:anthranilate synthase component I [Sorangium cellulosum]|uniref:Anthranilate synthase component I n=1 Tax=Sorangium cellulosum TaxID=56 RepID=A0A2L0EJP0_SORCE|nr:chorismate-binding protein [Sorangium cellulosum]AUX39498.1 anthranilate synthase component I [Sorangium cellulosum]
MSSLVIRTLPADHVTPVRAYAALRAQSPGRSSFMFESAPSGDRWGRHAILGYRVRTESLLPSGFDPFVNLAADLAAPSEPESLAARVSQSLVGFLCHGAVHPLLGVEPWPTETYLGRLMTGATVVVFDNVAQTMTIAGASQGAVNRCAWEMSHGPAQQSLPTPDPEALPEHLETEMTDEAYAAKVAAARGHLAAGAAEEVVLARSFRAPLRGADPFDVYRALRLLAPSQHLYFLDFAESPFAPGLAIAGASGETLVRAERDEAGPRPGDTSPVEAMRAALLAASAMGTPAARAGALVRKLESGPRKIYGGAVGYFGQEGADVAHTLGAVWLEEGYFELMTGARIANGSDPGAEAERTRHDARGPLSAIRAAQEARKARDAAEEKRAAAEKAAAEKAAAATT